jgi:chloramphenicol-sensitive protein RarD
LERILRKASSHSQATIGLFWGVVAYALWGAFPLYFALLDQVSPVEVVAHRVIWSLVFLAIIITIARTWRTIIGVLTWRRVGLLALAATFLAINWGVYVYAVASNQVIEASLGYFINPLVSVALGVLFLRERLVKGQWVAVGIAVLAVLVLTVSYGRLPWISLTLALSFGTYGLVKKFVGLGAVASLTIETAVLAPLALIFLTQWEISGQAAFVMDGTTITVLLILLGPVTAIPLLAFGASANRIPLSTIGILQYMTPILQFLLGLLVFQEAMTPGRWIGFVLVWIALVVFTVVAVKQQRDGKASRALEELEVSEPN